MTKNELKLEFSSRLINARRSKNLTRTELVHLCGHKNPLTIIEYCEGKRLPNALDLVKLAEVLGVTTDYLLGLTK